MRAILYLLFNLLLTFGMFLAIPGLWLLWTNGQLIIQREIDAIIILKTLAGFLLITIAYYAFTTYAYHYLMSR